MDTLTRDRYAVVRGLMRDIERTERELARLYGQRDALIRELYQDGASVRTIAAALNGIQRSGVGKIVARRHVERPVGVA